MFFRNNKVKLYLVWVNLVGGDYLKKIYQKREEAEYMIEKLKERNYSRHWIQEIEIIKEEKIFEDGYYYKGNKLEAL
jgi:hypothetical protein